MNMREHIKARLNEVFCDVFEDESIIISDETTANDIEEWDSLSHISLVIAVQAAFAVKMSVAEIAGFKNVGSMIDLLLLKVSK